MAPRSGVVVRCAALDSGEEGAQLGRGDEPLDLGLVEGSGERSAKCCGGLVAQRARRSRRRAPPLVAPTPKPRSRSAPALPRRAADRQFGRARRVCGLTRSRSTPSRRPRWPAFVTPSMRSSSQSERPSDATYSVSDRSCRTASAIPAMSAVVSRESVRMNASKRRQSSRCAARKSETASSGPALGRRLERALGDLAADAAGVLAHGLQRPALHPAGDRDGVELGLEPVEREQVADGEERAARRPRPRRPVARATATTDGRVDERGPAARGRRRGPRARPRATSRSATRRALAAALRRRRAAAPRPRASRSPSRPASIVSPRSPLRPSERYQRVTASTRPSTPAISSTWTAGSTLPPSASIASQRPRRRSPRARCGRRATTSAGARAALGDELGDERRPERVDDEVGVDGRDQLAPQRVLGQQVAEALDHRVREVVAQVALEPRVVEQRRVEQRALDPPLGVGEQASRAPGAPCPRPARRRSASSSPDGQRLRRRGRAARPPPARPSGPRRRRAARRSARASWARICACRKES